MQSGNEPSAIINPIPLPNNPVPKDPRDPLQDAILDDFATHYRDHPEKPLFYILDIPTGTGKSAIFIKMVRTFFTQPFTKKRLPIFVGTNNKLLEEQRARLRTGNTPCYLLRSFSELDARIEWSQKRQAIETLQGLYKSYGVSEFPPKLARLVKHYTKPLPSIENGKTPENVASAIKKAIEILLSVIAHDCTKPEWRRMLTSNPWRDLLDVWAPLQLLSVDPAPLLLTSHNFSLPHRIVVPNTKLWKLETFSDLASLTTEWNALSGVDLRSNILVVDEADAAYANCLESQSTNLGNCDLVRCLYQFQKFAMLNYIERIGLKNWLFMLPRINALRQWIRVVPIPTSKHNNAMANTNAKKLMLDHAQHYHDTEVLGNFPNPKEHALWWEAFVDMDFDCPREHIGQKLFACQQLWTRLVDCNPEGNDISTFTMYQQLQTVLKQCDNILMPLADFEMYRASTGGLFYADKASLQTGLLENARLLPETRRDGQYILTLMPNAQQQKQGVMFFHYLQCIRVMHSCVTDINWELSQEPRDIKSNQDLFEYIRKYQGRFSQHQHAPALYADPNALLTAIYVYERTKSKMDLHNAASAQHQALNMQSININVIQTMASPESNAARWLKEGHTLVLSSATVGIPGVFCGTYDVDYIAKSTREVRPLQQQSLGPTGQAALDTLVNLNATQYLVDTTVLNSTHREGQEGISEWTDLFMEGLDQQNLLEPARSNFYATQSRDYGVRMLGQFLGGGHRNGLVMHQTNKDIHAFFNKLHAAAPDVLRLVPKLEYTYELDVVALCQWLLLDDQGLPPSIRIALYEKKWRLQFETNEPATTLENVFETSHSPLLLFVPFGAGDRGINFAFTSNGVLTDVEMFALTSNPYFGDNLRKDKEERNEALRGQEYIKLLAAEADSMPRTIMDSTISYASESYHALMPVVHDKNAQTIVQVLGRIYRHGTVGKTQLYLIESSCAMLWDVYHRWGLQKKGSHILRAIYAFLAKNPPLQWSLNESVPSYHEHEAQQVELARSIDKTITGCLAAMRANTPKGRNAYKTWQRLRNYALYEKQFGASIEEIDKILHLLGLPSAFLRLPRGTDVYCVEAQRTSYLTDAYDENANKRPYQWQRSLGQPGLIEKLAKDWWYPERCFVLNGMDVHIQPWFIQRFMRGVLGEKIVQTYVEKKMRERNVFDTTAPWTKVMNFSKMGLSTSQAAKLIEMGDFFYYNAVRQQLFVVDAKYWGCAQDTRGAPTIISDAIKKRKTIQTVIQAASDWKNCRVYYALINAAGSRIWQPGENEGIYVGSATMNPSRDDAWRYSDTDPFPTNLN